MKCFVICMIDNTTTEYIYESPRISMQLWRDGRAHILLKEEDGYVSRQIMLSHVEALDLTK